MFAPMDRAAWERRQAVVAAVRAFFVSRGFDEVETPSLSLHRDVTVHIRDFFTEFRDDAGRRRTLGLVTSPEHHMKRLLGAGWGDIFQICRFFRNGESADLHNPEFTGVEWYEVHKDYRGCMDTTEALVRAVAAAAGVSRVQYGGIECRLDVPFERLTVREAVLRHAGVDIAGVRDKNDLREACAGAGERCAEDDSFDDMFFRLFLSRVEPRLGRGAPTFLCDYPPEMAALSVIREADPGSPSCLTPHASRLSRVAERFELYVAGVELCNGFTELRDPAEQRRRFERQIDEKKRQYGGEYTIDEEFLAALEHMPPCAGNALGLDRLIMLLLGKEKIFEVLLFPFPKE
ncbi:MAG: EF-P lysine aminoacylase GenX [Deltaproteobacteria bacterium]|nr:EF-P lysine aminoacylase GenX [Deltaproteobacteria bacterium]